MLFEHVGSQVEWGRHWGIASEAECSTPAMVLKLISVIFDKDAQVVGQDGFFALLVNMKLPQFWIAAGSRPVFI